MGTTGICVWERDEGVIEKAKGDYNYPGQERMRLFVTLPNHEHSKNDIFDDEITD